MLLSTTKFFIVLSLFCRFFSCLCFMLNGVLQLLVALFIYFHSFFSFCPLVWLVSVTHLQVHWLFFRQLRPAVEPSELFHLLLNFSTPEFPRLKLCSFYWYSLFNYCQHSLIFLSFLWLFKHIYNSWLEVLLPGPTWGPLQVSINFFFLLTFFSYWLSYFFTGLLIPLLKTWHFR